MKKYLSFLAISVMVVMTGCSTQSAVDENVQTSTTTSSISYSESSEATENITSVAKDEEDVTETTAPTVTTDSEASNDNCLDAEAVRETVEQLIESYHDLILSYDVSNFNPPILKKGDYYSDYYHLEGTWDWVVIDNNTSIESLKKNLQTTLTGDLLKRCEALIDESFKVVEGQIYMHVTTFIENPFNVLEGAVVESFLDYDFDTCAVIEQSDDSISVKVNAEDSFSNEGTVRVTIQLDDDVWKLADTSYEIPDIQR
ncbi:MAG: hypothetical protein NC452_17980 [Eubacterium sp.]|nr:hypothetical protein [Eubacterium sp.]